MKGLAELVVSLCDLCEAEGRLLESSILRTVRRVGLLSLGLLFGAAALALLLAALYALLTSLLPAPAALALLGGASAAIAGVLLLGARGGAAPDGGVPPPEEGIRKAGAAATAPGGARAVAEAPKHAQSADEGHAPWARVAPYGHSGAPHTPTEPRKGAPRKGTPGCGKGHDG